MLAKLLVALSAAYLTWADNFIVVNNRCASPITFSLFGYQSPLGPTTLPAGTFNADVNVQTPFEGVIYAATGDGIGGMTGATKIYLSVTNGYYYILNDSGFNFGIAITPSVSSPPAGFCGAVSCTSSGCTAASKSVIAFPNAISSSPPSAPLYECPVTDAGYTIDFCPTDSSSSSSSSSAPASSSSSSSRPASSSSSSSSRASSSSSSAAPPSSTGVTLHPNGNTAKCIDVAGGVFANGTPVQIYDCNGSNAQKWLINRGNGAVQVAGTNYCLDAGSSPGNNVQLKIWTCYSGLAAQSWYYTADNRIALTNQGLCLDLTSGSLTNGNKLQTYSCTTGNTNQIWTE